jgi:hypothetical protein
MENNIPQFGTTEFNDLAAAFFGGKPKQESLEEAAEKYVEDFDLSFYDTVEEIPVKELGKKDFKEGAKWQSERMYSEEEVIIILNKFGSNVYGNYTRNEMMCDFVERWFEQFKK